MKSILCIVLLLFTNALAYQGHIALSRRRKFGKLVLHSTRQQQSDTTLWPVQLCVFAQMIGEGIAISSLPMHMTLLGASPAACGLAVSSFSVAQLVCCPLLVEASERLGRVTVLRICLLGATIANLGIAASSTAVTISFCRFISGAFAASVPVAQAAVTDDDYNTTTSTPLALGRLSATSQSAVVLGPLLAAALLSPLTALGIAENDRLRCVFALTALFAGSVLVVLALHPAVASWDSKGIKSTLSMQNNKDKDGDSRQQQIDLIVQPLLRLVALVVGWSLTLSVYCYGLFAPRFLDFDQASLSAAISTGAVTTIAASLAFPRIVHKIGDHTASALGLLSLSICLAGSSLVRKPIYLHSAFYLLNRFGSGIADTATATLVARYSPNNKCRARNLGFIQSTRAAARIFTPPLSGFLFSLSCNFKYYPGALPYLLNSAFALLVSPIPLFLGDRLKRRRKEII
mmetsp:Transcript_20801/g.31821  ORF Transcript_20801/g.31821 Transcript_20801/m.31821 type:complete len:460 (-) Transcript_20801:1053-2432(-)